VIGQIVNHYVIRSLIGQGGMGAVYLAEHSFIGRRAAIKVLRRAFADDGEVIARFMNEARAVNAIRHRNIIDILDVGRLSDGLPYLLMEYLEGESLGQRLARVGRLSTGEALAIVAPAASALSAAHEKGIVHRDLKPDNIFLAREPSSETERVVLLDFGVAKLRGDPSSMATGGALLGTPAYMAPEQCRGVGEVDARTDVYALGIILYQMLCGRVPFHSPGFGDVLVKHLVEAPTPPRKLVPGIPSGVEAMILRALAKDPADRFATVDRAWSALCAATPTPGPVATAAPATPEAGAADGKRGRSKPDAVSALRRSPLLAAAGAGVLLALGAWALSQWQPQAASGGTAEAAPATGSAPAVSPAPPALAIPPAAVTPPAPPATSATAEPAAPTGLAATVADPPAPSPSPEPPPSPTEPAPESESPPSPAASDAPAGPAPTAAGRPFGGSRLRPAIGEARGPRLQRWGKFRTMRWRDRPAGLRRRGPGKPGDKAWMNKW
jgi:tRNA A-37 threonylcarbamoyl transferase component Bud32